MQAVTVRSSHWWSHVHTQCVDWSVRRTQSAAANHGPSGRIWSRVQDSSARNQLRVHGDTRIVANSAHLDLGVGLVGEMHLECVCAAFHSLNVHGAANVRHEGERIRTRVQQDALLETGGVGI